MIISIDAEKEFDKTQQFLIILNKLEQKEVNSKIVNTIHEKPIASIIFYGEKLKAFLLSQEQ